MTIEYFFGPKATARSFAVRFKDDEWAIFSPPTGISRAAYQELEQHGRVTSLVAPNGMHWLGLSDALEAYPTANVYAPRGCMERIRKKNKKLDIKPLVGLSERATQGVRILDVPGFSIGETWAVVESENGPIWYVSDSCFNVKKLTGSLPIQLLMKWTKSGPGLSVNGLSNLFFLKDKPGYKRWFKEQLEQPPTSLVPGHGDVERGSHLRQTLSELVDSRL